MATAAFSAFAALLMSGLSLSSSPFGLPGLDSLAGWSMTAALPNGFWLSSFPGTDASGFVTILAEPGVWCTAASWVVAAAAWSAFCLRGTRVFDVLGAIAACAILVAGGCAAAWMTVNVTLWAPAPPPFATALLSFLPNALVPGIAAIVAAACGVPDRVRWEADEKE